MTYLFFVATVFHASAIQIELNWLVGTAVPSSPKMTLNSSWRSEQWNKLLMNPFEQNNHSSESICHCSKRLEDFLLIAHWVFRGASVCVTNCTRLRCRREFQIVCWYQMECFKSWIQWIWFLVLIVFAFIINNFILLNAKLWVEFSDNFCQNQFILVQQIYINQINQNTCAID
jgi:hypothetical protein